MTKKILEVSSDFPHCSDGDDDMKYLVLNGLVQPLFSSLLSMLLFMVFRLTVMDFIWMQEHSFFKKNEQNEKVLSFEELH